MKWNKNKGFTLIEAVICIALIALITAAFLSMALSNLTITDKMNSYDKNTSDIVTAYDTGRLPENIKTKSLSSRNIDIGSPYASEFTLRRAELYADGEDSGITYYYYK